MVCPSIELYYIVLIGGTPRTHFFPNNGAVVGNVQCTGFEEVIANCTFDVADCAQFEVAAVECQSN